MLCLWVGVCVSWCGLVCARVLRQISITVAGTNPGEHIKTRIKVML